MSVRAPTSVAPGEAPRAARYWSLLYVIAHGVPVQLAAPCEMVPAVAPTTTCVKWLYSLAPPLAVWMLSVNGAGPPLGAGAVSPMRERTGVGGSV